MIFKFQKFTFILFLLTSGLYSQSREQNIIDVDSISRRFKLEVSYNDLTGDVILANKNIQIKMIPGMSCIELNQKVISLPRPITVLNGQIFVDHKILEHLSQLELVLPEKSKNYIAVLPKDFTILIDPGHGGKDPVTAGNGGEIEKKIALTVALFLKEELEHMGATAVLTRAADVFIPLPERPLVASMIEADLFISLHLNFSQDSSVEGVEIFTYRYRDQEYEKSRSDVISQNFSIKKILLADDCYISMGMENELIRLQLLSSIEESHRLASTIMTNILDGSDLASNRGIKEANFVVLRNSTCPSVLLEIGFLSHAETERKFQSGAYCKSMANRIANGILKFWKEK